MTIEQITQGFQERASNIPPFGKTLKFAFDTGNIFIDGRGEQTAINNADGEADTTISMKQENFLKMMKGELNPMTAVMTGKIKISGDMGLAMKLKELLG